MARILVSTLLGLAAATVIVLVFVGLGRAIGRDRGIPWVCDDTRYVDTVPFGRGVVGPAVSAPPGCGR